MLYRVEIADGFAVLDAFESEDRNQALVKAVKHAAHWLDEFERDGAPHDRFELTFTASKGG